MKYSMSRRMPDTQMRPAAVIAEGSQLRPLLHCRMVATTAMPAPTGQITLHSQLTALRNAPSGCAAVWPCTARPVAGVEPKFWATLTPGAHCPHERLNHELASLTGIRRQRKSHGSSIRANEQLRHDQISYGPMSRCANVGHRPASVYKGDLISILIRMGVLRI